MATTTLMTAADLVHVQGRCELIQGEIVRMAPAGDEHGFVSMNAGSLIREHVRRHRLGRTCGAETGFLLERDPDTVRAPVGTTFAVVAPDLMAEVVSPSDSWSDIEDKTACWPGHGVQQAWLIDPRRRTVDIVTAEGRSILRSDARLDGGAVLPDFGSTIAAFFA